METTNPHNVTFDGCLARCGSAALKWAAEYFRKHPGEHADVVGRLERMAKEWQEK